MIFENVKEASITIIGMESQYMILKILLNPCAFNFHII
jgi:hypothetical protein